MTDTKIIRFEGERLSDLYDAPPPLSRDIYYWFDGEDGGTPWLAHVCTSVLRTEPRALWLWSSASLHQLISREPLHLEPSIGWMECCGRHGFIRNGQWEPAGDGGWQP